MSPLILIIEDDPSSRKLLRDVLAAVGYQSVEADNAEEGIRLAGILQPRVILMDIRLPGISGIDALRRLREGKDTRGIPVVAVTASVMPPQRMLADEAGFDAIEPKPVNVRALLATVRRLVDQSAVNQAP